MDEAPTFACGMCGRCFANAEQIRLHIQTHTGQQPFRCVVCWPLFYDMSDNQSVQPCTPSKPVLSAAVTPVTSKGAPVSQVEDTGKGLASDKVSSAASDKTCEPSDTPSPQGSVLTSLNPAAARKTDIKEGSAVGMQTSVTKGKGQSIADKSQSESLTEALDSTLLTNDDGPPVLEPEIDFVINSSSKGLKSQENTMLDPNESVVGKVQSGFVMASTDQNILTSAAPKDVLVDNGQKENPAELPERDSAYAEIDPAQNMDIPSNRVTEVKHSVCTQNDLCITVPCDNSVTKRQNRDSFIQQKVMTDTLCNSQTDELLKDSDKTTEPARSAAGIETAHTNPSKESSQNSSMLLKTPTSVCDSDFINETDLRSENFDVDKDKNLAFIDSCTKLPSINVCGTDLSCIQYSFEDLVSAADFQENQLVRKALSESDSQDSFCQELSQGSDHSDKQDSPSAEQFTSSCGRRKKGKPKKLSVEDLQTPLVGKNFSQEAGSLGHHAYADQQHADEMDCTEMQIFTQQVPCSPAYSEGNENLGKTKTAHHNRSSDLDHNVKDSAKKLEMVAQPSTLFEHQEKITPGGRLLDDVAQGAVKRVSSEKPVRHLNDMSDSAVNFQGVISFLKNFPVKVLPDSKNPDGKVSTSIDQLESDKGPLVKTADTPSSSPDLTHSWRCGEKEESNVKVGNENTEICHLAEGNTMDKLRETTNKHFGETRRELPCINNCSKSSILKDSCNSLSEKSQVELELQTQTLPTETAATGDSVSKDVALAPFSGVRSGSQSVPGTGELTTADQQMTDLSGTVVGANDTLSSVPVLASTGGKDASDRVHISAEVRTTQHSNNSKTAKLSSSGRKNPVLPETEYNLSVCLPKLSENTLQSLRAGKTVNVNKVDCGKSHLKFSRYSIHCNDLKMSPAQLVQTDCSGDMHQGPHGQDIHSSNRQYHSNEVCPSEIDCSSSNCKLATQETSEQTEQQKSCQKNTCQDSYPESASKLNLRIPDPEQRSEIHEREQEQSQTSHQNVTYSKDLEDHMKDSSPNVCTKEVKNHVNKLCKNKGAQSNMKSGIQRKEPCKQLDAHDTSLMEGQTSVSAGALECSSQVIPSSQNNVPKSTRTWPVMANVHLQQRTKTGQMRKPLISTDGQIMSLTQTDSDHGEHVGPQQTESSINQDSNDSGETVHPVSSDMKKKDCHVETSASREEHEDRQSMLDVTASQVMVVPLSGKQAKEAAETLSSVNLSDASDGSSAVFRPSEESVEIIDLPKIIQPRRARLKQKSSGYYWKSSHAKTCAIVIKGRQNGHLGNASDVPAWDKKDLPLNTDCYVDLGGTLKETQFQSLLTQQDSSQSSSLIMTTAVCDQDHVEKEQTSASIERTPQMDLALKKNTSDNESLETDSVMSKTSNLSLTYDEIFTPSVAELVKCTATRRKSTVQSGSHPPCKKDKTSDEISKETGMPSEMHGASNIQMQEIKGGFSNKQNPQKTAGEEEKVSHDEESLNFQEKDATHSPTKKLTTCLSQTAYATPDGVRNGQILCRTCTECGAVFRKHMKYLFHLENGCKRRFVCKVCGTSLGRKESLKAHMTIHTGEAAITCQICGKKLCGRQSLGNHMRIHTGEKPYKCSECTKSFRQSSALSTHIRIHSKERPFKCDICDKTFSCHKSFHSHQVAHLTQRPFACHVCDAAFHQKSALNVHLRSHSNDRPFPCNFCGVRFAEKSERDQHVRQDHSHTIREMEYRKAEKDAKPHLCTMCNRGFNTVSSMLRHKRSFCLLLGKEVPNSE